MCCSSAQTAAVGTSYQNPRQDVQAPDLYLPMMGFFTYCIVASFANVISGKFAPEVTSMEAQPLSPLPRDKSFNINFPLLPVLQLGDGSARFAPRNKAVANQMNERTCVLRFCPLPPVWLLL